MSSYKATQLNKKGKNAILTYGLKIVTEEGIDTIKLHISDFTENIAKRAAQIIILKSLDEAVTFSNTYINFLLEAGKINVSISRISDLNQEAQRAIELHNNLCDHLLDRMLEFLTDEEVKTILALN